MAEQTIDVRTGMSAVSAVLTGKETEAVTAKDARLIMAGTAVLSSAGSSMIARSRQAKGNAPLLKFFL